MKFRMLFVAALLAMCSLAFAQGSSVALSENTFALTNNCDGSGGCIPNASTLVSIYVDMPPANVAVPPCTVGPRGAEDVLAPLESVDGQPTSWNFNQFLNEDNGFGLCGGWFLFDSWVTSGGAPIPSGPYYMEISGSGTVWTSDTRSFFGGPTEWDAVNWCCRTTSTPCNPTQLVTVPAPAPQAVCIDVCAVPGLPPSTTRIIIPGCPPNQPPHVIILPGCDHLTTLCDRECVAGLVDPMGPVPLALWTYVGGAWVLDVTAVESGCVCVEWLGCEPPPCTPSPDYTIAAGNSDPAHAIGWPRHDCLEACVDQTTVVHICDTFEGEVLDPEKPPYVHVSDGCLTDGCTNTCEPGGAHIVSVVYNTITGCWDVTIMGHANGCYCFSLDGFLSADLLSFDVIPLDNSMKIEFATASETNMDAFEIVRSIRGHEESTTLARIDAEAAAGQGHEYSYVDASALNGTTYTYRLIAVEVSGDRRELGVVEGTPSYSAAVITEYALHQNFPNPFNPTTQITFDLVNDNSVSLKVFNIKGQEVGTVVNGTMAAGRHTVTFDAGILTSGLYFYTVKVGNEFTATKKMMLVK